MGDETHLIGSKLSVVEWLKTAHFHGLDKLFMIIGTCNDQKNSLRLYRLSMNYEPHNQIPEVIKPLELIHSLSLNSRSVTSCQSISVAQDYYGVFTTNDGIIQIFEIAEGQISPKSGQEIKTSDNAIPTSSAICSQTNKCVVSDNIGNIYSYRFESGSWDKIECYSSLGLTGITYKSSGLSYFSCGLNSTLYGWDDRLATSSNPDPILKISPKEKCRMSCVTSHPTLPNILSTGSYEGHVHVWDIRKQTPLFEGKVHNGYVSSVSFDEISPSALLSSSHDGSVCAMLVNENIKQQQLLQQQQQQQQEKEQYLIRDQLFYSSLPFNSVHTHSTHDIVAAVGDDEFVYLARRVLTRWVHEKQQFQTHIQNNLSSQMI